MTQSSTTRNLPSVCPLDCPDTCSLTTEVRDGVLLSVKGSRANPYTDGKLCTKVTRYYPDFVHGDKRLKHPLKRVGARGDPIVCGGFYSVGELYACDDLRQIIEAA